METFLNEKRECCTPKQTETLEQYRKIDILKMLTEDDDEGTITSGNAGVILITQDHVYQDSCRRILNRLQLYQLIRNNMYNLYIMKKLQKQKQLSDNCSYISNSFETIILRIWKEKDEDSKVGKGYIVIHAPKKISKYQYDELLSIMNKLSYYNNQVIIQSHGFNKERPIIKTPSGMISFLQSESREIIKNTTQKPEKRLVLLRAPESEKIELEEVKRILEAHIIEPEIIEQTLSQRLGSVIRNSLEQIANQGLPPNPNIISQIISHFKYHIWR